MRKLKKPGVIVNLGSGGGLNPMFSDPVYSGSKGSFVEDHVGRHGISATTVGAANASRGLEVIVANLQDYCNELENRLLSRFDAASQKHDLPTMAECAKILSQLFDTNIITKNILEDAKILGGFIPMETVVNGALELITDKSKAGACLWITNRRGTEYWPLPEMENKIFGQLLPLKWKCKAYAELPKTKTEQAWALVKDYCNIHKIMPASSTCEKVEGTNEVLGCVRYCARVMHPSDLHFWARERLVALDDAKMSYSYDIFECSTGVEDYTGTMRVGKGGEGNDDGCRFKWSMECKPL